MGFTQNDHSCSPPAQASVSHQRAGAFHRNAEIRRKRFVRRTKFT